MTSAEESGSPADITRRPGRRTLPPAAARIPNQRRHFGRKRPADLVFLAREGLLADTVTQSDDAARRRLYAAGFARAYPVVFQVVTRKVERARGHGRCARGVRHLAGDCLDSFHDDVEALVEHLLGTATPIADLDAWLAYWAPKAAVDGHRRRRGERGALQRPRMTKALAAALRHDPWLMDLSLRILTWVGIPATAGAGVWPLDEWSQSRAELTGDAPGSTTATVAAEIEHVLAILRRRPGWFAEHVERPLGRKPAPVAPPPGDGVADPRPLLPAAPDELDDAHTVLLAGDALSAIAARLSAGHDPAEAVVEVLTTLFLGGSGAERIGRPPGADPATDERLSARLGDPAALAGLVDRVLRVVRELGP